MIVIGFGDHWAEVKNMFVWPVKHKSFEYESLASFYLPFDSFSSSAAMKSQTQRLREFRNFEELQKRLKWSGDHEDEFIELIYSSNLLIY